MSVRRLAEIPIQPPSFAFDETFSPQVKTWIAKYPEGRQQSAVIPLLMLAQEQEGWVSKAAIESIADMLKMPYIRALEVATFYTQFQLKPTGSRAHVQVCGTTPCMLRGSEALMAVCREKIHHDQFHLNAAGTLSWEEVECLGACVNAPMVMIFKDAYEDLTPERLAEIIDAFERGEGASVPVGPQNGRFVSAPQSGQKTLTDEQILIDAAKRRRSGAAEPAISDGGSAAEAGVSPSKAARPTTSAPETNATIVTPSPVKADSAAEVAKGSVAPAFNGAAADKAEPSVEGGDKGRERPRRAQGEPAPHAAPEYAAKPQAGESGRTVAAGGAGVSLEGQTASEAGAAPAGSDAAAPLDHADRPAAAPRPERPDDLKLISGIGPKIEGILHGLGIYAFAQISAWNQRERHWVDGYLRFHGRVERDNWAGQAKALAEGGEEEYFRVFGRKPR